MKFAKILFTVVFSLFIALGLIPDALSQDVKPGSTVILYGNR